MIYKGKEIEFPAVMQISFFKLIETLKIQSVGADTALARYAKDLLSELERYPALNEGVSSIKELEKYKEPVDKLCRLLFPDTLLSNEIKLLTPLFYFEPLRTSTRFENIIKASGELFSFEMKDVDDDTFYLYCCYFILGSYYGYQVGAGTPQLLEVSNKNQGIMRTYKILINADMSEFVPTEKAINITKKDFEELMDNFGDIHFWKKKFPPNSWIMRGISLVNLVDVTQDQSIGSITANLLVKETDTFEKIRTGIRRMLANPHLDIGVLALDKQKLTPMDKEDITSILLEHGDSLDCNSEMCDYTFTQLMIKKEPLVITNTAAYHEKMQGGLSARILASPYKSYIVAPMVHEDELLGFMEIGALKEYELHKGTLDALNGVLPILAMAHKRFMTESQNMIEAIIQQECTTIHPSVKWRFEEAAKEFMIEQLSGGQPEFKDIAFDNLYPLYGQMDIKGSSEKRNDAVSSDLIKQIEGVNKVLKRAFRLTEMPAYEELIYRLDSYKRELKKELSAGSEHKILSFLKTDIYPVFDYLKKNQDLGASIEEYNSMLDVELGTVYQERKKYDLSVNMINQRLASYLDSKQIEAQNMFPHYFERYKTDGVEYNMYIGQSITREMEFDKIHLRNLRIWQLLVMCEMEEEFSKLKKDLHVAIEVASLILVYNTPLSVHFRMDEKQFDVEGAYNARYEIIKKRVDKAHIKGTTERITKPGNIVIVYSQEQDANEYRNYLHFLAAKGYLKSEIEDFELEDLQGVHGLHALRVQVAFEGGVTLDELIQEIEGASK